MNNKATDRLIVTREEVSVLHARFEAELARQAAKAAEAASKVLLAGAEGMLGKSGRKQRGGQRKRDLETPLRTDGTLQTGGYTDSIIPPGKGRIPKKKKRSALANASNPHHLRNYVPSRMPHTAPPASAAQAALNAQNNLGPCPTRFLAADMKPRRPKKSSAEPPPSSNANPTDEWICAFCEYDLFYGDETGLRRALRNRKKILRRRRRARERAAFAASRFNPVAPAGGSSSDEMDDESPVRTGKPPVPSANTKNAARERRDFDANSGGAGG